MPTKKEVRAQRQAWREALNEGRVIRHNGGIVLTSFPSLSDALSFMHRLNVDGNNAERVHVSFEEQDARHGIGARVCP